MSYFTITCSVEGLGNFKINIPDYSKFTAPISEEINMGYQSIVDKFPAFEPNTTIFYYGETPRLQQYIEAVNWPSELSIDISKWIGKRISFSNGWNGIVTTSGLSVPFSIGFIYNGVTIPLCRDIVDNLNYLMYGMFWYFPEAEYRPEYFRSGMNIDVDKDIFDKMSVIFPHIDSQSRYNVNEQQAEFYKTIEITTDPFNPGGGSGTGGGGGDFDNTSTPIEIPSLPSISAASTGFITLFNPGLNELNELASYLWSDLFEVDGWKKLFADPMDAILGLSILPVSIPSAGTREVKVGNIGTGISLTVASSQFVEVDCGSINVNEYWGAYLDYEPYTQAQIFLPYIGTRPISVDEIMGKTVRVVYHVDILTGACCCFVKCGDSVLYTYNGQCSIPIPITGANYTSVVNGVISIAASVGSLVATGGASAPTAIPAIASSAVNQMKPQVEKSGSISGSAGVLNMQIPYLILIRPRQALPSKQNEFIGYPSLITVQLNEITGYTEVQSIHLENIPATEKELAEIDTLLKGGVIF